MAELVNMKCNWPCSCSQKLRQLARTVLDWRISEPTKQEWEAHFVELHLVLQCMSVHAPRRYRRDAMEALLSPVHDHFDAVMANLIAAEDAGEEIPSEKFFCNSAELPRPDGEKSLLGQWAPEAQAQHQKEVRDMRRAIVEVSNPKLRKN
jgi:hypothetical protein